MKRWTSYVFIFIFAANAIAIAAMGIWYINDQDYFTENFCVNKEKVELNCKGRCHLRQQVSGQTEKQKKQEISVPILEFEYNYTAPFNTSKRLFSTYIMHTFIENLIFYKSPQLRNEDQPPIG